DIDQHEAGQDLAGAETVLQQGGYGAPSKAAGHAQNEHQESRKGRLQAGQDNRDHAAGDGADNELPLGSDIPDLGGGAEAEAGGNQNHRSSLDRKLFKRPSRYEWLDEQHVERMQRLAAD